MRLFFVLVITISIVDCYSPSRRKSSSRSEVRIPHSKLDSPRKSGAPEPEQPSIHVSHVGIGPGSYDITRWARPSIRPNPKKNCFWKVASCQTEYKHGHWDKLDCKGDPQTIECCDFECNQMLNFEKAMEREAKRKMAEEAQDKLDQLKRLEAQRDSIRQQLREAQEKVVQFVQPEVTPEDLLPVANLPPSSAEELDTLVEVADAIINTKSRLKESVKENLEEKVLDNIIEVTREAVLKRGGRRALEATKAAESRKGKLLPLKAKTAATHSLLEGKIKKAAKNRIGKLLPFAKKAAPKSLSLDEKVAHTVSSLAGAKEAAVKDFVEANDIMTADDPFSEFLRDEMEV